MIQYMDHHMHTHFSFDSEESFENYFTHQPKVLVSTDHFDLKNPCTNGTDCIPDYQAYLAELNELSEKHEINLLRGIEIGMVPGQESFIQDYLTSHPYDIKVLSIHHNGQFDFMDPSVCKQDPLKIAAEYFNQMNYSLEHFTQADILAHFDYGLRQLQLTPQELEENFEADLISIFQKVIELEMAFELNSKSILKYQNKSLYAYAIPLYQSLGGQLFTLGSDAHVAEDYQLGFDSLLSFLTELGINQLTTFENSEKQQVLIASFIDK